MNFFNNIVNELDIALRTLSDKKTGTERCYPPDPCLLYTSDAADES